MEYVTVIASFTDEIKIEKFKEWTQVVEFLKTQLDQWVTSVKLYKFSSDSKTLGYKTVTMSNLFEVVSSPNDKILK